MQREWQSLQLLRKPELHVRSNRLTDAGVGRSFCPNIDDRKPERHLLLDPLVVKSKVRGDPGCTVVLLRRSGDKTRRNKLYTGTIMQPVRGGTGVSQKQCNITGGECPELLAGV